MFSFMMCADIMRQAGSIKEEEWNYFLRGNAGVEGTYPSKPDIPWLSEQDWKDCCNLEVDMRTALLVVTVFHDLRVKMDLFFLII